MSDLRNDINRRKMLAQLIGKTLDAFTDTESPCLFAIAWTEDEGRTVDFATNIEAADAIEMMRTMADHMEARGN